MRAKGMVELRFIAFARMKSAAAYAIMPNFQSRARDSATRFDCTSVGQSGFTFWAAAPEGPMTYDST